MIWEQCLISSFRNSWIGVKHRLKEKEGMEEVEEDMGEVEEEEEEKVDENDEEEEEGEVGVGSRENDDGCKSPAGLPTL